MQTIGKYIVLGGIILIVVGLIFWMFGNKLTWLGRLPGDIRIEKENVHIFFPITTMIIVSIVLSLIMWLIRKFS